MFDCQSIYIWDERGPWIAQEARKLGTRIDTGLQIGPTYLKMRDRG